MLIFVKKLYNLFLFLFLYLKFIYWNFLKLFEGFINLFILLLGLFKVISLVVLVGNFLLVYYCLVLF